MAIGTTAAIVGAAAIGAGSSIISGNKAAKAAKQGAQASADANLQASREANELQRYMYDTTRADYQPYRETGNAALGKLAQMYGVSTGDPTDWEAYVRADEAAMDDWRKYWSGGEGSHDNLTLAEYGKFHYNNDGQKRDLTPFQTTAPYGGFETSPGYQFRLDEGIKAIERSAAARGGLNSGATMKALNNYAQGVASSEYENYANRLAALAGVGQTATNSVVQAGQSYASGAAGNIMSAGKAAGNAATAAGNARSSAYANTGNAINQGLQGAAAMYLYNQGYGGRA